MVRGLLTANDGRRVWVSTNNCFLTWKSKPAVLSTIVEITVLIQQEQAS